MPILFKRTSGWRWLPDADDTNAPEQALLRADNTISDRIGSRSLRFGSKTLYSRLGTASDGVTITAADTRVHSLYSCDLEGTPYDLIGVGSTLYVKGGRPPDWDSEKNYVAGDLVSYANVQYVCVLNNLGEVPGSTLGVGDKLYWSTGQPNAVRLDGSKDFAIGDDSYQTFIASGKNRLKWDGKRIWEWGIAAPVSKPTLTAINSITYDIADFDLAGETNGNDFTINEGAGSVPRSAAGSDFVDSYVPTANKAIQLTPDTKGRASCTKKWDADEDMLNFRGNQGGQVDLFDMRVHFTEPRKVDKVTIMFGLDSGADPFKDNYYYFDFQIRNDGTVNLKDTATNAVAAYAAANNRLLSPLTPQEATAVKTPDEAGRILRSLGRYTGTRSKERPDASAASPAWGHLSVTRGQFSRVGGTNGRNWSTVRGFKVVYTVIPGSTEQIFVDDAVWYGGGQRTLNGEFQVGYRFARKFLDVNGNEVYTELSPMSPISDKILMQQQSLTVTIPARAMNAKDPQVNQVWIYLYGGFLDTYYRVSIVSAGANTGMQIDDIGTPSNFVTEWAPYKGSRLTSHGFSVTDTTVSRIEDKVVNIYTSELDAMMQNEPFEPGATTPPNRIISIAGPWNRRIFCLTEEGWLFPSTIKSPSSFSVYQTLDLRMYGTPYWVVKTVSGVFVGCSKDIVMLAGSGDNNEDGITADIWVRPMNVGHPPVDRGVTVDGNAVVYRSSDGPMWFSGASSEPMPFAGTKLLWRGEDRHGVSALNTETGRFRFCEHRHYIYMTAPEGSDDPTSLWRFAEEDGEWVRFTYPGKVIISLEPTPLGKLLAGTTTGEVLELESGAGDDGAPIPVHVLTPLTEGESPLTRKEPADLQLHVLTGGATGHVAFQLDRSNDATKIVPFSTSESGIYRCSLLDMDKFIRLQARITGDFTKFSLHGIGLTYYPRPMHCVVLNLGKVIPEKGGDLAWVSQVELDVESANNLLLDVYKNGVLHSTEPVAVVPGVRDMYTITMPRDTKARRIGLVLRTVAANGEGSVGFECYMARVRSGSTGNWTELDISTGDNRSDS